MIKSIIVFFIMLFCSTPLFASETQLLCKINGGNNLETGTEITVTAEDIFAIHFDSERITYLSGVICGEIISTHLSDEAINIKCRLIDNLIVDVDINRYSGVFKKLIYTERKAVMMVKGLCSKASKKF